jgi:hypothetical protein
MRKRARAKALRARDAPLHCKVSCVLGCMHARRCSRWLLRGASHHTCMPRQLHRIALNSRSCRECRKEGRAGRRRATSLARPHSLASAAVWQARSPAAAAAAMASPMAALSGAALSPLRAPAAGLAGKRAGRCARAGARGGANMRVRAAAPGSGDKRGNDKGEDSERSMSSPQGVAGAALAALLLVRPYRAVSLLPARPAALPPRCGPVRAALGWPTRIAACTAVCAPRPIARAWRACAPAPPARPTHRTPGGASRRPGDGARRCFACAALPHLTSPRNRIPALARRTSLTQLTQRAYRARTCRAAGGPAAGAGDGGGAEPVRGAGARVRGAAVPVLQGRRRRLL